MAKKRKKTKTSNRRKPNSSPSSTLLFLLGLFIVVVGVALLVFKFVETKKYDPSLEKKLDMKTLPADVKQNLKYASPSATYRVPVLMYHYVEYVKDKRDTMRQSLDILPSIFEDQVKTLKDNGYTFMTASELGDVLDGRKQMPYKPIILTFDDGHWDLYTDVYPILQKYNVKATAYIIPGFLGGSDFLEPDQVQELAKSGLIEIGAHTVDHTYLKSAASSVVLKEVNKSKIMLQDEFNIPVVSFAYPYGAFDEFAIKTVKDAGFKTAMSTLPGIDVNQADRFFIQRIRPGGRTGETLLNYLDNYTAPKNYSSPQD